MLINTVVLLLRELLPLVVLAALLLAVLPLSGWRFSVGLLLLVVPGLLLQMSFVAELAAAFDGLGLELWYAMCYLLCCGLLTLVVLSNRRQLWLAIAALSALFLINGSNLMLYLAIYPRQSEENPSLWLGVAIGSGISISIGVLLFHLVRESARRWPMVGIVLLCANAGRQLSASLAMLQQSDWLNTTPAWHSQWLLNESSELGYFLNALFGYEMNPSYGQVGAYAALMLTLLALRFVLTRPRQGGSNAK